MTAMFRLNQPMDIGWVMDKQETMKIQEAGETRDGQSHGSLLEVTGQKMRIQRLDELHRLIGQGAYRQRESRRPVGMALRKQPPPPLIVADGFGGEGGAAEGSKALR
jgi:hypothetical protein